MQSASVEKKVWAWSYEGEDEAKRYVKHHLMHSSNHHMSADDADGVLDGVNAVILEETYDEREAYRLHVEALENHRAYKPTEPPEPTEPPPRRRSRSRSGASRGRASGHDSYHGAWQGEGQTIGCKANGKGKGKEKGQGQGQGQ